MIKRKQFLKKIGFFLKSFLWTRRKPFWQPLNKSPARRTVLRWKPWNEKKIRADNLIKRLPWTQKKQFWTPGWKKFSQSPKMIRKTFLEKFTVETFLSTLRIQTWQPWRETFVTGPRLLLQIRREKKWIVIFEKFLRFSKTFFLTCRLQFWQLCSKYLAKNLIFLLKFWGKQKNSFFHENLFLFKTFHWWQNVLFWQSHCYILAKTFLFIGESPKFMKKL